MELIEIEKEEKDINMLSPLVWAYMGDAIYEMYIRTKLINLSNAKPHKLHKEAIQYVKAQAQAHILKELIPELTEKELEIVRRGRNAENHHLPKNAELADYTYSTAFEGLVGYLYLTKQEERLKQILDKSYEII